jgi:hypothetical protein
MTPPSKDDHGRLVRKCYERAKTILRQRHDAEFHAILAEQYEQAGLEIHKRKSRIAAQAAYTEKENTNG